MSHYFGASSAGVRLRRGKGDFSVRNAAVLDPDDQQFVVGLRQARGGSFRRLNRRRGDFGEERIGARVGRREQIFLSAQSGLKFVSQGEPLMFGTRAEIAERTDHLLAGALGREDTLHEEVVEISFAFVGVRGFANIHRLVDTSKP